MPSPPRIPGRGAVALAAALAIAACAGDTPPADPPDLLLVGGTVLTLAPDAPRAEAVAVRDGRIAAVGPEPRIRALRGPGKAVAELEGATVVPAFTDHHVHLLNVGLSLLNEARGEALFLDLSGAGALAEVAARVGGRADSLPPGAWVLGKAWSQASWGTEELPEHGTLTGAAPERPAFLARVDGHAGWVNAAAMRAAGVADTTRDPDAGAFGRLPSGEPSGILLERAVEPFVAAIPAPDDSLVTAAFRAAAGALAARGVVEAHDAGFLAPPGVVALDVDLERYLELLRRADAERPLPLAVSLMVPAPSGLAEAVLAGRVPTELSPRLRITHLKLFADGALGSRGAALTHPYADDPSTRGVPRMTAEAILAEARRALDAGLGVATHAIGDEAVRRVLDAYGTLLSERPGLDPARLRIEHFSYARAADFERVLDLGVVLSIQSNFNSPPDLEPSFAARRVGAENEHRVYAWRRLHRAGAPLAEGSDYFHLPGAPLLALHSALTARNALGLAGEGPEGRLPALRLVTRRFPPQGGGAGEPVLAAGRPASLAILSADPTRVPVDSLLAVRVHATLRDGALTHHDGSLPGLEAGDGGRDLAGRDGGPWTPRTR